jgi:ATP-dependent helicase/nuclease subunit A
MATTLDRDTEIYFPHFVVLKASAGSGKTYTLTQRYVQFLLSEKIPGNGLKNILAITFSNNAAKEMKERVLLWLKSACFGDPGSIDALSGIISLDREELIGKAGSLIDGILRNYSDFQVRTIDSFMTAVFKASAVDFGYSPEFDILIDSDAVMAYSFDLFLRGVREGTAEAALFDEILSFVLGNKKKDASYLWDPSSFLLEEIKKIYQKLASTGKRPIFEDHSRDIAFLKVRMKEEIGEIEELIERSGLERNGRSSYRTVLPLVREGRIADIMGKGLATPPVNKTKQGGDGQAYESIVAKWAEFCGLVRNYTTLHVLSCCSPYIRVHEEFRETVERVKKRQGKVFIEDINRYLAEYLGKEIVPDVYFRIGATIFHYLIDEFQDTSPIQWRNLFPLIENSLSQGGSAFVVGDTKQAIYGFRNADYTIMKKMETENLFPSARHEVKELDINYRSLSAILDFNEKVFKEIVPSKAGYREAGARSGLTDYLQKAKEEGGRAGFGEVEILGRNDDDPPERSKVQDLIMELRERGYGYGDIAVLTQKNQDAVRATVWLNERDIPFISYSSLDVRKRKITGEIVSLLTFLDSPTDDLSFATFITGDIFMKTLEAGDTGIGAEELRQFLFTHRGDRPLYKSFQKEYAELWERYFSGLFRSSGYFPLYDLVSSVFSAYRVFDILKDEEAALVKILEVVKDFEGEGSNSLGDFLDFAGDGDDSKWNMDVPRGIDAVKVMTIHKSKGLGFPVVIVLLYEERNRGFDYITHEDEDGVRLLKITRDTVNCSDLFESLYRDESVKDCVNRLNSLYVGFTRPEKELYVIGVKGKSEGYPFDLLPKDRSPLPGKPGNTGSRKEEEPGGYEISHHHKEMEFPVAPEEAMRAGERRRGEFIHAVLSHLVYAGEGYKEKCSGIIREIARQTGEEYPEDEILRAVGAVIEDETMNAFFREMPGREVWTEKEFVDREGNLFRMDRVINDPDRVVVIDYKTGGDWEAEEKYASQMKNYMRILAGVYPKKKVEGIIYFIDRDEKRVMQ